MLLYKLTFVVVALWANVNASPGAGHPQEVESRGTNAERMSRGIAPLKPKRLYDPSRISPAKSRRSASPQVYVHVVANYFSSGATAGYLYKPATTNALSLTGTQVAADVYSPASSGQQTRGQVDSISISGGAGLVVACSNSFGGQLNFVTTSGTTPCAKNAWDTNGTPGGMILDFNAGFTGAQNIYYQTNPNYANLLLGPSAANINSFFGTRIVQEADRVLLYLQSN